MDFSSIAIGFEAALQPTNLLYVLIGVVIGTVIGVLPGLGPTATIALLLPLTYSMDATGAIIMLAGIYYGSMYGGTITSVLLRIPGEAASVVTAIDGYQMARNGRAGPALGIAAIGSFIGGIASFVGLLVLAPFLARLGIKFGPPEFAVLAGFGILLATWIGTGSRAKAVAAAALGLALASIGQDPISGTPRMTFGSVNLLGGIDFVALAMGLFGVGEILYNVSLKIKGTLVIENVGRVLPTREDMKTSRGPIVRGSLIGFLIGILPGGGGVVSSLASYAVEKRKAREPERFGKGAIEGVAGPETANNASSTSAFIPLLTLGVPSNSVLALLFGALLLQGIVPGPQLMTTEPQVFWGVIASMLVGNLILLVLNIPMVSVFIRLLKLKFGYLAAGAVLVTMIGTFSLNNSVSDMMIMVVFGIVGYGMRVVGMDPGPLVLAFVLGPLLEESFRQSMLISNGSLLVFVDRPITLVMILAGAAMVAYTAVVARRRSAVDVLSGGSR